MEQEQFFTVGELAKNRCNSAHVAILRQRGLAYPPLFKVTQLKDVNR